ncbi:MAG: DUF2007 domain-containing protein [Alphaproteobacteria bacterium]|nr:DUF2007 domain-containing protein [Alphaproteobacteria bacterium]MBU6473791.1 DUF2007 domain-containing protein [Alphaproteobacteria bacterium]MDE2012610.1 DUF2007 domain-containing protein [Alphaproteobacteria bacterium]MDE2073032.1 DUF2007 domain-containing protein [Alphaproteobacteria bacterium]MDE2350559.1 DUF2007 domain-containing protein [Alphaproteobacteria bacterium]
MREILKTNNPVELSFARAVLEDAGIACVVFDAEMSVMDGSLGILPRRLMVADNMAEEAAVLIRDAMSSAPPAAVEEE